MLLNGESDCSLKERNQGEPQPEGIGWAWYLKTYRDFANEGKVN